MYDIIAVATLNCQPRGNGYSPRNLFHCHQLAFSQQWTTCREISHDKNVHFGIWY